MRHLVKLILVAALFVLPATAQAGFILEGSVGTGAQVDPSIEQIPTNVMIAPGYGLGTMLRLELGFVSSLGDAENSEFDIELRPMVVFSPPVVPIYGRLTYAVTGLLNDRAYAYGGALGVDFEVLDTIGIFAEAGLLPRKVDGLDGFSWIVEGRAGAYFNL